MGGSRSVDRRQIRGYVGGSGDRGGHGSHRRFGSARRICGLGGRPNPGGARWRANHLVRTAYCVVAHRLPRWERTLGARQGQSARPGFLCLRKSVFREAGMQPQGLTRKSISVPPCSFTLLFSELTIEPSFEFSAIDNFRFEIPTTPWVFPVTG